jgi:hypothetical protein
LPKRNERVVSHASEKRKHYFVKQKNYFAPLTLNAGNSRGALQNIAFWRRILPPPLADILKLTPLPLRWNTMSDAYDYFKAHAIAATQKARALPFGRDKQKQRVVARVYHLLAREAAFTPNVHHLDAFRSAQRLERQVESR